MAPGKYSLPFDLLYVQLLYETRWPPDVLDKAPLELINKYIIYQNVRTAIETGGEYQP